MTSFLRRLRRLRRRTPAPLERSERELRRSIERNGGSLQPARPGPGWQRWRNRALQSEPEVDEAITELTRIGLVPHPDRPKNFDHLVALGEILSHTGADANILEMGAATYSPLLVWLYQYGYRNLNGIDLTHGEPTKRGPIRFERMDLQHTAYPDASFDAIACMSVIEHGVDVAAYLAEARRLLRPGGILVTSTDYWPEPLATEGKTAYGVPVHVFTEPEVRALLQIAERAGLVTEQPVDLSSRDKVVHWARMDLDYTFVVLTLVASGGSRARG